MFLFSLFVFQEDFVLKKILNEFSVLMHKKEIHTSFLFIDDYSKADNEG